MSNRNRDEDFFKEHEVLQVNDSGPISTWKPYYPEDQSAQIDASNVPEYLLERSRRRRAQLAGQPFEAEEGPKDGLGGRLSGIVDMYGEPCSLLAEHVAIAAGRIMERSQGYINNPPANADLGYICLRHLAGTKEDAEMVKYYSVPLTGWQSDMSGPAWQQTLQRSVRIELASEIRSAGKKRLLGRAATHMAFADAGQAYLLAVTRSHVAVPILGIRMDREQPNCSFITFEEAELPDDMVAVTKRDMSSEERQRKLTAVRKLMENHQHMIDRPFPVVKSRQDLRRLVTQSPRNTPFDLRSIGAIERLEQVLGPADHRIEFIIEKLQSYWHSDSLTREIETTVSDDGIVYPALVKLSVGDRDSDTLIVDTALILPDAPSFGTQQVFPTLRVYPASRHPLRFDGIDCDTTAHDLLVKDFYELIGQFKTNEDELES